MGQKRFSQIVVASVALSLLVGVVWGTHTAIKAVMAAQSNDTLCFTIPPEISRCYPFEKRLGTQPVTAIATDGKGTLVSSNHATIEVWSLTTGQRIRSLRGHSQWVTALAISPNGKTLASGSLDGTINIWDLQSGILQATLFTDGVTVLAFSPDGSTLASGSRLINPAQTSGFSPIQIWDMSTGRQIATIETGEPVTAIAFSPDGERFAFGRMKASVWDLPSQRLNYTVNSGELNTLIFSADGRLLLTGSDGVRGEDGIKFWEAKTGKLVRVLDSVAGDFALSPNGEVLLTTYGGNVNAWRMKPFGYLGTLRGSIYSGLTAEFGLNGQAIVTGSSDGVKVWFPTTSELKMPR